MWLVQAEREQCWRAEGVANQSQEPPKARFRDMKELSQVNVQNRMGKTGDEIGRNDRLSYVRRLDRAHPDQLLSYNHATYHTTMQRCRISCMVVG